MKLKSPDLFDVVRNHDPTELPAGSGDRLQPFSSVLRGERGKRKILPRHCEGLREREKKLNDLLISCTPEPGTAAKRGGPTVCQAQVLVHKSAFDIEGNFHGQRVSTSSTATTSVGETPGADVPPTRLAIWAAEPFE